MILRRAPEDVPTEAAAERAFVAAIGLKSDIALPLKAGAEVLGALGVDHLAAPCDWSAECGLAAELLASVYANALYRRRARARLQRAADLNRSVLASVSSEIIVIDRQAAWSSVNEAWARSPRREGIPAALLAGGRLPRRRARRPRLAG